MPIIIHIPTPLRNYTGGEPRVLLDGRTVGELLAGLTSAHPDLKRHLYSGEGTLRNFVNVYVNDDDIRHLDNEETPVKDGDEISIIPSIAGGSGAEITLSNEEIQRYSRHLIMPEVTMEGQKKLKGASVLLIGAGGLGSPMALYLAAAGVGRIGLVDFDVVDYSNLQRQILHGTSTVDRPKLESARNRLNDLNPHVEIKTYEVRLDSGNALEIFRDYDVVADGTDNFPTRYLVNDACVLLNKPNVYGSIFRFEGQASVFHYEGGPCYRCLYPEPPPPGLVPSCAEGGVLGILPGLIGVIQATEVVKILMGIGETLSGRLMLYDALSMKFRELKLRRNKDCPICGDNPSIRELIDYEEFCGLPGAQTDEDTNREVYKMVEEQLGKRFAQQEESVEADETSEFIMPGDITAVQLKERMDAGDDSFVILDVREPHEVQICSLPGAVLIPMNEIPARLAEIDHNKEIVCQCRIGARSAQVAMYLAHQGFKKVKNLEGGLLAWAEDVDQEMPVY